MTVRKLCLCLVVALAALAAGCTRAPHAPPPIPVAPLPGFTAEASAIHVSGTRLLVPIPVGFVDFAREMPEYWAKERKEHADAGEDDFQLNLVTPAHVQALRNHEDTDAFPRQFVVRKTFVIEKPPCGTMAFQRFRCTVGEAFSERAMTDDHPLVHRAMEQYAALLEEERTGSMQDTGRFFEWCDGFRGGLICPFFQMAELSGDREAASVEVYGMTQCAGKKVHVVSATLVRGTDDLRWARGSAVDMVRAIQKANACMPE